MSVKASAPGARLVSNVSLGRSDWIGKVHRRQWCPWGLLGGVSEAAGGKGLRHAVVSRWCFDTASLHLLISRDHTQTVQPVK